MLLSEHVITLNLGQLFANEELISIPELLTVKQFAEFCNKVEPTTLNIQDVEVVPIPTFLWKHTLPFCFISSDGHCVVWAWLSP